MTLAACAVAAMADDFALAVATINEIDERPPQPEGAARERAMADQEAAWDRLYDLQDAAMAATATSQEGIALQLALGIDELTQLETIDLEHDEREAKFKNLRKVLRSALMAMDARLAFKLGIVGMFVGYGFAEQWARRNVAPKPS